MMKKVLCFLMALVMMTAIPVSASAATMKTSDIYNFGEVVKKVYTAAVNRKSLKISVYYKNGDAYDASELLEDEIYNSQRAKYGLLGDHASCDYFSYYLSPEEVTSDKKGYHKAVMTGDYYSYYTTDKQYQTLKKNVAAIVKQLNLKSSNVSKFKKILRIYNFLCSSVTYDYDHYQYKGKYRMQYTGYAAICNGTGVCAGYADAFYILAKEAGLNVKYISNDIHAYNIVEIGGKYYNVDATWDSTANSSPTYRYFLECNSDFRNCSKQSAHQRAKEYNTSAFNKKYPMASKSYFGGKNYTPKCKHAHKVALYTREGTCGVKSYGGGKLCKDCGMVFGCKWGKKGAHSYQKRTTQSPTCTAKGAGQTVCHNCSKVGEKYVIAAKGHKYKTVTVEPTCNRTGYTEKKCQTCGTITDVQKLPLKEHSFDNGVVKTEPTCAREGRKSYTCKACGYKKTESIPKTTEHAWKPSVITVTPTCTRTGVKKTTCSVCGVSVSEELPKTEHVLGLIQNENEKAATCTADGSYDKAYYCSVCKKCYKSEHIVVPKLGHDYRKQVVEPTCTTDGYTLSVCSRCNDTVKDANSDVAATGHHYNAASVAATCVSEGYTKHVCTLCQHVYCDAYTKPTGNHTYGKAKTVQNATPEKQGKEQYTCKVCGFIKTQSTPKVKQETVELKSVSKGKTSFTAKWKTASHVSGYQIQYAKSKDFKHAKSVTVHGRDTDKTKVKNLKKHTKYYVRIRTYKTIDGKKRYSKWSKRKSVSL